MIYREKDTDYPNAPYYDLVLDDVVLSDFDDSTEQLQHLLNIDCALALSVCKSRNLPSCVFVLSLLYMKRLRALKSLSSLAKVNDLTTKELYLIAALIADKYLIDEGEDAQLFNSELAELTGIDIKRINRIERQVLSALNWNLNVPDEEYNQFLSSFKRQISKRLNKSIEKNEIEDSTQFYNLCCQIVPQIMQYLALTSLVVLGSTISILTAIHISALTHSTLMKTLSPNIHCLHSSACYSNENHYKQVNFTNEILNNEQHSWMPKINFMNESVNERQSSDIYFDISSCSINLLRPYLLSRPIIPTSV